MGNTKLNKNQVGSGIWTQDNLVAGKDISLTLVPQPVIDEYTTRLCHFDDSVADAISGQSNWPSSTTTRYFAGKFGRARGESITSGLKSWTPAINFNVDTTLDFWVTPKDHNLSTTNSIELRTESNTTSSDNIFLILNNPTGSTPTIQIGKVFSGTGALQTIQWPSTLSFVWGNFFHIAFEKDATNGKVYLFVDGKKVWENVHTDNIGSSITIYARYSSTSIGSIEDEARISSVVRWIADFTPFSVPYAATAGDPIYQINNAQQAPDLSGYLENTATGTNSFSIGPTTGSTGSNCISIGKEATTSTYTNAVAIGNTASAQNSATVAIGSQARAWGVNSVAVGSYTFAYSIEAIAIGTGNMGCTANASKAIQLGEGTNTTASSFQVYSYQMLDGTTGKIPMARLPIVQCTQAEYDALVQAGTVDSNTLYLITNTAA